MFYFLSTYTTTMESKDRVYGKGKYSSKLFESENDNEMNWNA